eukprot:TRINITY_DN200_c2_g1_i1.p1 TRINITY_DN200_c2_g1~~TRINITY_DN200_c2_g1_i1.p1  ORF type:complete len:558 (-),score=301.38 TRINITY_DN200_c2_g1_i1:135-1808(-)
MSNNNNNNRKVAVIVGASSDVSKQIALQLASEGYNFGFLDNHEEKSCADTLHSCEKAGARFVFFQVDYSNSDSILQAIENIYNFYKQPISTLVHSVITFSFSLLVKQQIKDIEDNLNANLKSLIISTRATLPFMDNISTTTKSIVVVSAFQAIMIACPAVTSFAASLTAVSGFARSLFEEVRHRNIKVSLIYPGPINSQNLLPLFKRLELFIDYQPEKFLQPCDVAKTVSYLINHSSTACTCELQLLPLHQPVSTLQKFVDPRPAVVNSSVRVQPDISRTRTVAIITGASKGIGRDLAIMLAKRGYDLALMARSINQLQEVAAECKAAFAQSASPALKEKLGDIRTECWQVDVSNFDTLEEAVVDVVRRLGAIHVCISNAGINRRRSALRATRDAWDDVLQTNLRATMHLTRTAIPFISQNELRAGGLGRGAVVYISSFVAFHSGIAGVAAYYASKHGLNGFSGCVFEDVRHMGIKVSTICPGLVNTELGVKAGPVSLFPGETLIQCEDIAHSLEFVLNSSPTCCPTRLLIQPQIGLAPALTELRESLEAEVIQSKL